MNKSLVGIAVVAGVVVCGRAVRGYAIEQGRVPTSSSQVVVTTQNTDTPPEPVDTVEVDEFVPSSAPTGVCGNSEGGCGCGGAGANADGGGCGGAGGCGCGGGAPVEGQPAKKGGGCGCGG